MATQNRSKATGDISTPQPSPQITQVRNMAAATASGGTAAKHPPGKICVRGYLRDEQLVLNGIAARVYNSTDDGPEPPDDVLIPADGALVTYGRIAEPRQVENRVQFDFTFQREPDGADNEVERPRANPAPGYFDDNWLIVWARWTDSKGALKCDWKVEFKIRVRGQSSVTTECGDG